MNTIVICMSLVVLMQGWDRPVIQESELAAPAGIQQEAQTSSSASDADSWDIDSGDTDLPPLTETPQPVEKEVVTRWEYDDEGRPVAHTEERPVETTPQPVAPLEEKPKAQPEDAKERRDAGRIATFWFLLPRR